MNLYRRKNVTTAIGILPNYSFSTYLGTPLISVKLNVSSLSTKNYTEKRIGYLGISQLLDESSDILMLATNCIKKDLNAKESYVIALGLTAIAECSTVEMCRELYPEVKRLMKSASGYIRQRATLAAIRTLRNIPDAIEDFLEVLEPLI